MASLCRTLQRFAELVKLDLVGVGLGRIGARVPHESLQCDEVAPALAEEAIGEAMAKLERGEVPHTGPPAYPLHHPPQRLLARRRLRVFPTADALVLRSPELNLHRKDVIAYRTGEQTLVPPTEFELGTYTDGSPRYKKIVRFSSIGAVKAGWLVKEKGVWRLTAEGQAAYT